MQIFGCSSDAPEIMFHLRWIAKIALSIGAMAAAGLWLTLTLLTDNSGTSYGELIQSSNFVHAYLGPMLLIGGCLLVACAGLITWLIALYSSFRVAGPLFRFSRNIERAIAQGPIKPIPIREDDRLHRDAILLTHSLAAVEMHYRQLELELEAQLEWVAGSATPAQRQVAAGRLGELIRRASI